MIKMKKMKMKNNDNNRNKTSVHAASFPLIRLFPDLYTSNSNSKNISKWIFTSLFRLKVQEFNVIQVLFKSSPIFQRFKCYNSHSQGEDSW